jgi:glucoamylase
MIIRNFGSIILSFLTVFHQVHAQTCQTFIESSSIPTSTAVELYSYSYCGGTLDLTAYVKNIDYNKIVEVHYTNAQNEFTPLSVISLSYNESIANTNWEYWSASTPVYVDGITELINITYAATDVNQFYSQQLGISVAPSGSPPPSSAAPPTPYATPSGLAEDITTYLTATNNSQAALSKTLMFANIDVSDAANGTVIAAQSYTNPNYAYNWVRDASLTMDVVQQLYAAASSSDAQNYYSSILFAYSQARATEQTDPDLQTGLGEPKFLLNNSVFTGPWGRPQNDGAATSAVTLMNFANSYIANGGSLQSVKDMIYDSTTNPAKASVQKDLLFVAANWSSSCFDIWEEEESYHFYNRLVYHKALIMGATFATKMGDSTTSSTLSSAAKAVAATLTEFWDPNRNLILYEYGPVLHDKSSFIDIAVILGVLRGYVGDGLYSYIDDKVLATAFSIASAFVQLYPIADVTTDGNGATIGIPIGRYPEDVYDGYGTKTNGGNPWFLCTAALAELFYHAANELRTSASSLTVSNVSAPFWAYFAPAAGLAKDSTYSVGSSQFEGAIAALEGWADAFMRRIRYHSAGADGHLAEEFHRETGYEQGAADLTWSYAAFLTAAFARAQLMNDTGYVEGIAELGFGR